MFFKEGSFIQRLPPYFELQPEDQSPQGGWSAQKVTNIHLMLQVSQGWHIQGHTWMSSLFYILGLGIWFPMAMACTIIFSNLPGYGMHNCATIFIFSYILYIP